MIADDARTQFLEGILITLRAFALVGGFLSFASIGAHLIKAESGSKFFCGSKFEELTI
jgi:hypothetical protein